MRKFWTDYGPGPAVLDVEVSRLCATVALLGAPPPAPRIAAALACVGVPLEATDAYVLRVIQGAEVARAERANFHEETDTGARARREMAELARQKAEDERNAARGMPTLVDRRM